MRRNIAKISKVSNVFNQNNFRLSVIERNAEVALTEFETADARRAANQSVDQFALERLPLAGDLRTDRLDIRQRVHAREQVRQSAERAFVLLRRFIRHVCKQTECRDIAKPAFFVELAHVHQKFLSADDIPRRRDGRFGKTERGRHIVDRAAGNVAERRTLAFV